MKSILISEEIHKELTNLKLNEKDRNMGELITKLVIEHKKNEFLEASRLFRKRMDEKGISLKDLLKTAKKVRRELVNEPN